MLCHPDKTKWTAAYQLTWKMIVPMLSDLNPPDNAPCISETRIEFTVLLVRLLPTGAKRSVSTMNDFAEAALWMITVPFLPCDLPKIGTDTLATILVRGYAA